jgi:hypothetical protein
METGWRFGNELTLGFIFLKGMHLPSDTQDSGEVRADKVAKTSSSCVLGSTGRIEFRKELCTTHYCRGHVMWVSSGPIRAVTLHLTRSLLQCTPSWAVTDPSPVGVCCTLEILEVAEVAVLASGSLQSPGRVPSSYG